MTDSTARGPKAPAGTKASGPKQGSKPGPKASGSNTGSKASGSSTGSRPGGSAKGAQPSGSPGAARPQAAPATRGAEDTVARPNLKNRIGSKLAAAAQEHRDTAVMKPAAPGSKQPRRARLRLTRVDPWSVMKASFLLSIAFGIVLFVAIFIVWSVLGAAGVWESINSTVATVMEGDQESDFDITEYVGMSRVLGFTALVAVLDVILITAMATLAAFLYNMAAALLGGIEVTLSEDR